MTIETKYNVGDVITFARPHIVKTRKASFPDWETVEMQCPGVKTVRIVSVRFGTGQTIFDGVTYGYRPVNCECGREDTSNVVNESSL